MFQIKKGFPNKILGIPYGWKDLGLRGPVKTERVKLEYPFYFMGYPVEYDIIEYYVRCTYCSDQARLAKQGNEVFQYCKRCLKALK